MDDAFLDIARARRLADDELGRAARDLAQQQRPGVRVERSEQRSPGSYRYYEHIEIRTGPPVATLYASAHAQSAPLFSPLLALAVVAAAAWAAVTALFARNYDLTTFSERARARLLLTWPYLLAFSRRFRGEFASALRGEKVRVTDGAAAADGSGGGSGGSSGGSGASGGGSLSE